MAPAEARSPYYHFSQVSDEALRRHWRLQRYTPDTLGEAAKQMAAISALTAEFARRSIALPA